MPESPCQQPGNSEVVFCLSVIQALNFCSDPIGTVASNKAEPKHSYSSVIVIVRSYNSQRCETRTFIIQTAEGEKIELANVFKVLKLDLRRKDLFAAFWQKNSKKRKGERERERLEMERALILGFQGLKFTLGHLFVTLKERYEASYYPGY